MKNTLLAVFIATTIALGVVAVVQWQKLAAQKTEMLAVRADTEQRTREIADLQASQQLSEQQRQELFKQADDLARKLQVREQEDAKVAAKNPAAGKSVSGTDKPDKEKNPFGDLLAKMMEDPDTRKVIRQQQRAMLDQLYGPLVKKLGLTAEQAGQFKDLLADNMMKGTEKASSLMGGASATNRTEMLEKLSAEQKDFDEKVRGFLGETAYAQYKDYQQTVGERTQLSQFQQQNASSEHPLTDQQSEKLLAFMKEEKQAVAASSGLPLPGDNQDPAQMQAMFSGEGIEKLLQSQETINQRVYARASEVLSPEQLSAFGTFQTNQFQMMRMGMTMARKFMVPEKTEGAAPSSKP